MTTKPRRWFLPCYAEIRHRPHFVWISRSCWWVCHGVWRRRDRMDGAVLLDDLLDELARTDTPDAAS